MENETNYLEYMTRRAEIMDELNDPRIIRGSDGWEFLAERFSRGKKMPHTLFSRDLRVFNVFQRRLAACL